MYRGLGIWYGKASRTEEHYNTSQITVTPEYFCLGEGSQLYRTRALTRQMKNDNGTWYGTNSVNGKEARHTC